MNWEALAATAELLGALGVLASLVYLGLKIRQNTGWLRQQAFQLSTNEIRRWASQPRQLFRLAGLLRFWPRPMP